MRIGETLRKAAGLIVEFDPPDPAAEFYRTSSSNSRESPPHAAPTIAPSGVTTPTTKPSESSRVDTAPSLASLAGPAVAQRTVEQVVRDSPGPNLDEIKAPVSAHAEIVHADGSVDFGAIYRLASLHPSAFSAEQVLDLLGELPAVLPLETKRATVRVTLKAMTQSLGITSDTIVADASRKLAALAAFAQSYVEQTDAFIAKSQTEIQQMEAEIARRKQSIADATARQTRISDACHAESDRLDEILEFFTLDVSPSKYASNPPAE